MGWLNQEDRARLAKETGVAGEYLCDADFCGRVIPFSEMPVVDPKGGFYPKPPGTPDFMPKRPKRTFHYRCDQIRRGKRPKEDRPQDEHVERAKKAMQRDFEKPEAKKKSPKEEPPVKNNGHASKKLMRVVEMVTEAMKKSPKKTGSVWGVIQYLKDKAKMADVRAACRYLKSEGRIGKTNGVLVLKRTKP